MRRRSKLRLVPAALAAVIATAAAAAVPLGVSSCGGAGGAFGLGILTLGGSVVAPNAFARGPAPLSEQFCQAILGSPAHADVSGLTPIPGAIIELFTIDASGNTVGSPVAAAVADASGNFTLVTTVPPSADMALIARSATGAGSRMRLLYGEASTDLVVDPTSEFVARKVLATVSATGVPLRNFDPNEVRSILDLARNANLVAGGTIDATVNALEGVVGPQVGDACGAAGASATNNLAALQGAFAFVTLEGELTPEFTPSVIPGYAGPAVEASALRVSRTAGTTTLDGNGGGSANVNVRRTGFIWDEDAVPIRSAQPLEIGGCTPGSIQITQGAVPRNRFTRVLDDSAVAGAGVTYTVFGGGLFSIQTPGDDASVGYVNPAGEFGAIPTEETPEITFLARRGSGLSNASMNGTYHAVGMTAEVTLGSVALGAITYTNAGGPISLATYKTVWTVDAHRLVANGSGAFTAPERRKLENTRTIGEALVTQGVSVGFACGTGGFGSDPSGSGIDLLKKFDNAVPAAATSAAVAVGASGTYSVAGDGALSLNQAGGLGQIAGALGVGGRFAVLEDVARGSTVTTTRVFVMAKAPTVNPGPTPLSGRYRMAFFFADQQSNATDFVNAGTAFADFTTGGQLTLSGLSATISTRGVSEAVADVQLGYSQTPNPSTGAVPNVKLTDFDLITITNAGTDDVTTYSVDANGKVTTGPVSSNGALFTGFLSEDLSVILFTFEEETAFGIAVAVKQQ